MTPVLLGLAVMGALSTSTGVTAGPLVWQRPALGVLALTTGLGLVGRGRGGPTLGYQVIEGVREDR